MFRLLTRLSDVRGKHGIRTLVSKLIQKLIGLETLLKVHCTDEYNKEVATQSTVKSIIKLRCVLKSDILHFQRGGRKCRREKKYEYFSTLSSVTHLTRQ